MAMGLYLESNNCIASWSAAPDRNQLSGWKRLAYALHGEIIGYVTQIQTNWFAHNPPKLSELDTSQIFSTTFIHGHVCIFLPKKGCSKVPANRTWKTSTSCVLTHTWKLAKPCDQGLRKLPGRARNCMPALNYLECSSCKQKTKLD